MALIALLAALLTVAACSPTLNWREVRPEGTRLALLLPCKPDKAEKTVPLGGRDTLLAMLGCEAGGATFAVAVADLGPAATTADVLGQWQRLSLSGIQAETPQARPLKLPGATGPVQVVSVEGVGADGAPVRFSAAWFAQGTQVFQVVMLGAASAPPADAAETFFSSLRFQ